MISFSTADLAATVGLLLEPPFADDGVDVPFLQLQATSRRESVLEKNHVLPELGESPIDRIHAQLGRREKKDFAAALVLDRLRQALDLSDTVGVEPTACALSDRGQLRPRRAETRPRSG